MNGATGIRINNRGLFRMTKIKDAIFNYFACLLLTMLFSLLMRKLSFLHSWVAIVIMMITIGHTFLTNVTCIFIGAITYFFNFMRCFFSFLSSDINKFSDIYFLLTIESDQMDLYVFVSV